MEPRKAPDARALTAWRQAVGACVRTKRVSASLTQSELARQLGWSRTTLVAIEAGRQVVNLHQLVQLGALLRATVAELVPASVVAPSCFHEARGAAVPYQARSRRRSADRRTRAK